MPNEKTIHRCASCGRDFGSRMAWVGHQRAHGVRMNEPGGETEGVSLHNPLKLTAPAKGVVHIEKEEGAGEPQSEGRRFAYRIAPMGPLSPLYGKETGFSIWYAPFEPKTVEELMEVPLRHGATPGGYFAKDEEVGTGFSMPAGSLLASEITVILNEAGDEAEAEEAGETEGTGAPEEAAEEESMTEEEAVAKAVESVGRGRSLFESPEEWGRNLLKTARRRAKAHPNWDDEKVIEQFWDKQERACLRRLLELGVSLRPGDGSASPKEV